MHGVKNDPGLIPTERELKLTTKTIEKGENKDHANILLSKAISKTKTKSPKSKHFDKPQSLNSVDSSRSGLVNSLSDEAYISSEAEENPVEKAEKPAAVAEAKESNQYVALFPYNSEGLFMFLLIFWHSFSFPGNFINKKVGFLKN